MLIFLLFVSHSTRVDMDLHSIWILCWVEKIDMQMIYAVIYVNEKFKLTHAQARHLNNFWLHIHNSLCIGAQSSRNWPCTSLTVSVPMEKIQPFGVICWAESRVTLRVAVVQIMHESTQHTVKTAACMHFGFCRLLNSSKQTSRSSQCATQFHSWPSAHTHFEGKIFAAELWIVFIKTQHLDRARAQKVICERNGLITMIWDALWPFLNPQSKSIV